MCWTWIQVSMCVHCKSLVPMHSQKCIVCEASIPQQKQPPAHVTGKVSFDLMILFNVVS